MLNNDYREMLSTLCEEKVKFILVGAYALAIQGYPRATMDIDFWVAATKENAAAIMRALERFGSPLDTITLTDFQTENLIFQIGVEPRRIDIITSIDGVNFEDAFSHSILVNIDGIQVHVISKEDIIINKRASGRTKDLADIEMLERGTKKE
jgi:predicted nucleotidyltransferase